MLSRRSLDKLLILGNQGLGDHLICNAIYRSYALDFKEVYLACTLRYRPSLRQMLSDLENIQIIPLNNEYVFRQQAILSKVAQVLGVSTLQLGHTDAFFSERPLGRLDQHFYVQAGLPIDYSWSRFLFNRNERRVLELNERLCIDGNGQYAFLHEDRNRGFIVKRTYISQGLRVIEPNPKWPYSIFDYCDVISRAKEIHCIESSFSIFIDSFDFPKTKLFAHRYARPEVYSDGRHEIGYRKNWDIVER